MPDASSQADRFAPGPERFEPLAGVAALVLPGLGHLVLGQPRRAAGVAIGVLGLFFGGLLLGGIDTIDSREDKLWFYGQALVGPLAFAADWVHQNRFKAWALDYPPSGGRGVEVFRTAYPGEVRVAAPVGSPDLPYPSLARSPQWGDGASFAGPRGAPKAVGKINEVALLACTLAGMMNLVAALDALFNRRPPERELYPGASA